MAQTQWAQVEFMADGEGYEEHDDGRRLTFTPRSSPPCVRFSRDHTAEIAMHVGRPTIALTIVASE